MFNLLTSHDPLRKLFFAFLEWRINKRNRKTILLLLRHGLYGAKPVASRRVTLPTKSTSASVHVRKKFFPLASPSALMLFCMWSHRLKQRWCMLWLSHLDPVGWAKVFIWRKVGPARRVTLPSQKGDWVGESSFQPSQSLVSHVNASHFKNWISQGSTHGVCRMSLQPKTTFLHITGPYNDSKMPLCIGLIICSYHLIVRHLRKQQ